jgi:ABC-type multidrug transport system ATPase subunit
VNTLAVLSTPTTDSSALQATRVSKSFPGGVTALDAVDLELPRGQLVALVGGNGAGKTTLLKLIAGHTRPDSGSVTVLGGDPARAGRDMRRVLASVSQTPALDPEMTVGETLRFFAILYELPAARLESVVANAARRFGLETILSRRVNACSGGMQQRLHLAATMLHAPTLMLLDEPTNNLDAGGRGFLWGLLREKASAGVAVLLSTHDLGAVEQTADRVLVMHQGRILADAEPQELMRQHGVPLLSLRFADPGYVVLDVQQSLQELDLGGEIVVREGSAVIALSGDPGEEARILDHLDRAGMKVSSATRQAPDLASACWALTKDWPDRPLVESAGRRRGRKH